MLKVLLYAAAMLLAAVTSLFAQETATLSGAIHKQDGNPFPDALVMLHTSADSTLVKTEITDEKGEFLITQMQKGNYFVTISSNSIPIYTGQPFALDGDMELETITAEDPQMLAEVAVTRQKQYVERQQGKL